jgi:hypothetical protein
VSDEVIGWLISTTYDAIRKMNDNDTGIALNQNSNYSIVQKVSNVNTLKTL